MEPLRIGVSARLLYPDSSRSFLPMKSIQYLEQSVANWIMSGEVLAFMIPEMSLASAHFPKALKIKHYVNALDGLLLQGGADMSPKSYGEAPMNPAWSGDEVRDAYEIELFHEFVTQGKPVFGICRGHQVINVALGGTLYQDIPTQCTDKAVHRDEATYDKCFHEMRIMPTSWLSRIYPGMTVTRVNTIHHQAVKQLGEGLVVEAMSEPDGVVEAMRWEGHSFVVGVQWHPEFMDPRDPSLIDSRPLLRAFLHACELRKRTGKATTVMSIAA
ncbi:MAG: gamma-glutamyl-gamma-aminobutyrate hydrolase family protein [Betaproteobacteria bacterium]